MKSIANQEIQRYTFEPLALALYIVTGLICLSPDRYRSRFAEFIGNNSDKLHIAYQASAGSILGWGIGTGAAFVLSAGLNALPLAGC
ncbi:hypothetical protein [Thiolapillus brandeum]|uniref:hypothetical protein n=1 Tax=Thiolapillus brandeum TaxID=1076588 RepID=UPI0011867BA9|nr:hypothetical protein [Thiolapillus brandeum]